jgi:hypothetical protein
MEPEAIVDSIMPSSGGRDRSNTSSRTLSAWLWSLDACRAGNLRESPAVRKADRLNAPASRKGLGAAGRAPAGFGRSGTPFNDRADRPDSMKL